jgi:hypothetical protein
MKYITFQLYPYEAFDMYVCLYAHLDIIGRVKHVCSKSCY